jgi:hypothetical protein
MTAAARAAALLRQFDETRPRAVDLITHAPHCTRPGVAIESGPACTVTRCLGCGAITTERNRP